jgi:hypothetical protein
MASDQSYSSHRRYFPWHHFVVVPILGINVGVQVARLIDNRGTNEAWSVIVALALFIFSFTARVMALRVQDRVIRLEERLRLSRLLPNDAAAIDEMRPGLLVAMRFAPDDEIPDLMRRVSSGELKTTDQIKRAIRTWRPDYLRA